MVTKSWKPGKVVETHIDAHERWMEDSDYAHLVYHLKNTELPMGIKFYIEDADLELCTYARANIYQWFWRHFGGGYAETNVGDDEDGFFVEIHRGTQWYEPTLRSKKMKKYKKADYSGRQMNNATKVMRDAKRNA